MLLVVDDGINSILFTADIHCTFEENLCGWNMATNDESNLYRWFRETANGLEFEHVPAPPEDHNDYSDTYFMIASDHLAGSSSAEGLETQLISPVFEGKVHPIECFSFWFYFGVRILYRNSF